MNLASPLVFEPLLMERVWGGRELESLYGKHLPPCARIGESWELVDREEAQSVVHTGELRGETLHQLWTERRREIFGGRIPDTPRFPLLFKLLDAQDRLSVQVHPPSTVAPRLGGEPKTEMWYFAATKPDADIFAGLRPGVTREDFRDALKSGDVAEKVHRIPVHAGQAIFIPSGRIHSIGAGNVIVEVQQNSDTTYRVFDWNRVGLDGKPRTLHISESLDSIDFDDAEPRLAEPDSELLVECKHFRVERWELNAPREASGEDEFAVFCCLQGKVACGGAEFGPGTFFLVAASQLDKVLRPVGEGTSVLRTTIPEN